jgi:hypothetical protein
MYTWKPESIVASVLAICVVLLSGCQNTDDPSSAQFLSTNTTTTTAGEGTTTGIRNVSVPTSTFLSSSLPNAASTTFPGTHGGGAVATTPKVLRLDSANTEGFCLGADNLTVNVAVKLAPCDRYSMKFEERDGLIRAGSGLCLHAGVAQPNAPVVLSPCSNSTMPFTLSTQDSSVQGPSGLCLHAAPGPPVDKMFLWPCDRFSMRFAFGLAVASTASPSTSQGPSVIASTRAVTTPPMTPSLSQSASTTSDIQAAATDPKVLYLYSANVEGLCLGADNLTVNAAVKFMPCDRYSMKFEERDGVIRAGSGLCLNAGVAQPNAPVVLSPCSRSTMPLALHPEDLTIRAPSGLCLHAANGNPGDKAFLSPCDRYSMRFTFGVTAATTTSQSGNRPAGR